MFEIMYLIFLAFIVIIAVTVCIYEICCRREAEKREAAAREDANTSREALQKTRLENSFVRGERDGFEQRCMGLQNENKQIVTDNATLRCQLDEAIKIKNDYAAANKALRERNFDDIMSMFECTIGEGGEEFYRKGSVYLVVRDGKCVEALSILDGDERPMAKPVPDEDCEPDWNEDWEPSSEVEGGEEE